ACPCFARQDGSGLPARRRSGAKAQAHGGVGPLLRRGHQGCGAGASAMKRAEKVLLAGLEEANRLFVAGEDAGRRGVIAALNAVLQFLESYEGTIDHRQPIGELLNALLSLGQGQVLPLLKPRKRRKSEGRAPASAARESDIGKVAFTVHQLCETGMDTDEACEMAAKVCREAGVKPSRRGKGQELEATARTVRGWCEKIAEDVARNTVAAKTFDRLR